MKNSFTKLVIHYFINFFLLAVDESTSLAWNCCLSRAFSNAAERCMKTKYASNYLELFAYLKTLLISSGLSRGQIYLKKQLSFWFF